MTRRRGYSTDCRRESSEGAVCAGDRLLVMGSVDEQPYSVKSQSGYNRVRYASKEIARMDEDPRVLVIDDDEALREL